jgi:hypothetical protein
VTPEPDGNPVAPVTARELARVLQVRQGTIRRWAAKRVIASTRGPDGGLRFDLADVAQVFGRRAAEAQARADQAARAAAPQTERRRRAARGRP